MRNHTSLLVGIVIALATFPPSSLLAQSPTDGLEAASFMVGCWAQAPGRETGLREIYAPPAANLMTGLSQFWRDGEIVDFEFHRLESSAGGPVLTPHPRGVASVSFSPIEVRADRIVWQNLSHDFPQRIMYERVGPDSLVVRIEGGEGADARAAEWRMARSACPASAPG